MKVAEIKKEIDEAYKSLKKLGQDKESREMYESKLKGIRDWVSSMDENFQEGEQIGVEKGRIEGEKQKAVEIAIGMLKDGLATEKISHYTNQSIEEIKNLKTFNKK